MWKQWNMMRRYELAYFSELLLSYWAGDRGSSKGPQGRCWEPTTLLRPIRELRSEANYWPPNWTNRQMHRTTAYRQQSWGQRLSFGASNCSNTLDCNWWTAWGSVWTDFTVSPHWGIQYLGGGHFFWALHPEALVLTVKTQQEEGKYVLEMHPELSTARPAIKGN